MDTLTLATERPDHAEVEALLRRHFDMMRAASPEESCHVMEPGALLDRAATLIAARVDGTLLGVGALTVIAPGHGELKSMHTAAEARGRGVGRAVLGALLAAARDQEIGRAHV